jgi:hypothetical protein
MTETRHTIRGPDLYQWQALCRVRRGYVAMFEGRFYDAGQRTLDYHDFGELLALSFATLQPLDDYGHRPLALTPPGRERCADLDAIAHPADPQTSPPLIGRPPPGAAA